MTEQRYKNDFNFFQNHQCRYFPCHDSIPVEEFNCLFCYCPLMFIECTGNYTLMENGIKDCSQCTYNHDKHAWKNILNDLREHMSVEKKFHEVEK